jgi:predicted DNA-binding ribbon-helix-helix protein
MALPTKKRTVVFRSRKTSVSLEDDFWEAIKQIAKIRQISLSNLVGMIEGERGQANLSSAIRVFVLEYYQSQSGTEGEDTQTEQRSHETIPI